MNCIITLYTPEIKQYAEIGNETKKPYCDKYGIDFLSYDKAFDERPPAWSKITALLFNLQFYKWLMWIDADAMIIDNNIDLFAEVEKREETFLFSKDENGINSGVFFVRNNFDARAYLRRIDAMKEFTNHAWWEQAAIHELYKNDIGFQSITGFIDKGKYNSYINDTEKGVILHLPGTSHDERVRIFNEYKQ